MSWKTEGGVWLGRETYGDICGLRKIEHLDLPIIYLVQLGERQVGLNRRLRRRIWQESELCPRMNKQ
jgi:hypothetical protein